VRRSGARTGIDPTAQKLKADQIHGSKRGCPTGCPTGWPDRVARRGARRGQTECSTGPDRVARQGARRCETERLTGPDEVPNRAGQGARRGPDGVPDGCHVTGHVIFECHVTRLGWQGVILLPTLVSQR
jgi:hypothetical protein